MTFDFPEITLPHDMQRVCGKIAEEAAEVYNAIEEGEEPKRVCEEIADVWQAVDTLKRKAFAIYGQRAMDEAKEFVINKNRERGYYGNSPE